MITKENIKSVMDKISKEDVDNVYESNSDYVALQLFIFNTDYVVELNSIDTPYCNDAEEIENDGGIVCDKDEFFRLFIESGSDNRYINELI